MKALIWAANVLGWPIIQLGIGRWMLSRPASRYSRDNWITEERPWEKRGTVYRRVFAVHQWKRFLPDGAAWLGGSPNNRLATSARASLASVIAETRRAELAHWYMMFCAPIFFLWNPWWARGIMVAYGVASNLPCIFSQRFNRARLSRCIEPRENGSVKREPQM